jgi:hypothetical protein
MKSTPNLPASSRMKNPSGGGPSIKSPIKEKAMGMSGGVPSKGKNIGKGKSMLKKSK